MNLPLLEFQDLAYVYDDGARALNGVSARIAGGESVAVVGGNGAGKSTLLMLLAGCRPPAAGVLKIGGERIDKTNLDVARRRVGIVFQDSDDQLFMPTVWDDVAFGPFNQGHSASEVDGIVERALEAVGASELGKKAPYRLSGGQKRLVAIASVLAMNPETIVLDEPTSNLDPKARRTLINTLNSLDHTRIVASHDLEMVLETCGRALVMARGVIIADGPARNALADEGVLEQARLERPPSLGGKTH